MAEGLMIAQVMADLQTIQNADPTASRNLLSASTLPPPTRPSLSTLSPQTTRSKTSTSIPRVTDPHPLSPTSKPRRPIIPRSASNTPTPPPLTRSTSSFGRLSGHGNGGGYGGRGTVSASLSASRSGSGVGTPVEGTQDPDLQRAKTLLELFEMRGKFKQMGDTGLTRTKQRVDNVVEKYARMELAEREKAARVRHLS